MDIKAIVLDIDGTLVTSEKVISEKTRNILIKAQEKGIKVILASGRPTRGMWHLAEELELDKHNGYLVSFNGARVTDCETKEVLFNQALDTALSKNILEHLKKFDVIPMVYGDTHMYVKDVYHNEIETVDGPTMNIVEYEARMCRYLICEQPDLAAFVDEPQNKILIAGNPEYLKSVFEDIHAPFESRTTGVFSAPFYYELTDQGIDKAFSLNKVLTAHGILPENVVSFGDGQNDRSIIEYAGMGVAMGNAMQEILDIADEVTLSNDHDGIAVFLERYI
ncbi:Cof-type HAD-IIB family hydrolase [Jeotgalibaca sp. A127]|uniref:Cof-type HAD-IIB family hydrolase n=1 Tax=Jeotgalibaca sp. A127 TaxID=3457324 RepID=UPI003FD24BFB